MYSMTLRNLKLCVKTSSASALFLVLGVLWTARFLPAQEVNVTSITLERSFETLAWPFLKEHCFQCHNTETAISGVRVDQLDAALEDRHVRLWEAVRRKISDMT